MIKTLSPHYIYIPLTNPTSEVVCDNYTLKIYIWDGLKNAVPTTPTYTSTKINASGIDGVESVNISRLVNDYINFYFSAPTSTSLEDAGNQVWVKTEVYYNDQPTLAQNQSVQLAVKGYGYFQEGNNPQLPTNKILLTGDEFKVNRNGFFVLPILLDETVPPTPTLVIDSITSEITIAFTTNIYYSEIFYRYRQTGDTIWTFGLVSGTTNPFDIEPILLTGSVEVQIFTYDPLTEQNVYSNIYTITL